MKVLFLVSVIISFSFCSKKKEVSKGPIDVIDTTSGNITFEINGSSENGFHIDGHKINNKIVFTGSKLLPVDDKLVPFQFFTICFNNKSLEKQTLMRLDMSQDSRYLDNTRAFSYLHTSEDDGCGGCESFYINDVDSITNWVQVTKQKNDFNEVWGNFSVSLYKTQDCKNRFYSNKLVIRNGYFHFFVQ